MKYLNAAQAAKRIGVSDKTIRRWLKEGKISAIRTENNQLMIPESEVEAHRRQRAQFVQSEEGQDTPSHDQTDITALAAKVAELEQEVRTLKQGNLPIVEQAPIPPISTPSIAAIPQTEVVQIRNVAHSEGTMLLKDFAEISGIPFRTLHNWISAGKIEVVPRNRTHGGGIEYLISPEEQEKAKLIDSLRTPRKSKEVLPEGSLLVDTFADKHGILREDFQHYIRTGIGHGTVPGEQTDPTLPVNETVDYSTHPKLGRYLTPEQQTEAIQLLKKAHIIKETE